MDPRIAVVGSCNLDQLLTVHEAPGPGVTVSAREYVEEPGGKGLNQALAAARAGADVRFVGAVGDDDAGRLVRRTLSESAIDASGLRTTDLPTGRAVIVVDARRENRIVLVAGANAVVALTAADRTAVAEADALLLQLELPQEIAVEAARIAHDAGVTVGLTPAPVQPLRPELLACTSILFANEHETAQITGEREPEAGLRRLLDLVPAVVVTRGAQGSDYAAREGARHHCDAVTVEAVDTTAAGDVYAGVFMAAHAEGAGVGVAMHRATVAASLVVQRRGTTSAIPSVAELSGIDRHPVSG